MPEWINLAKIRGSWAQVGNDASPYSIYSYYTLGSLLQPDGSNIFTNYWNDDNKKLFSPNLKPERKIHGKSVWTGVYSTAVSPWMQLTTRKIRLIRL